MGLEFATYTAALGAIAAAAIALCSLFRGRGRAGEPPSLDSKMLFQRLEEHGRVLREEFATSRKEAADEAGKLRSEVALVLSRSRDALVHHTESQAQRFDAFSAKLVQFGSGFGQKQDIFRDKVDALTKDLREEVAKLVTRASEQHLKLRESLRQDMEMLRTNNERKLDQIRGTVDEKLQKTLEHRLGESFKLVSDRLDKVHAGLGEMQSLAVGVGDLKRVLGNVKTRGIVGEVQLFALVEDFLAPEQYVRNADVNKGTGERVEIAIRMPGRDAEVLTPIDSKFPQEPYEALLNAYDAGEAEEIRKLAESLGRSLKNHAKEIQKYINPPHTTDFAIMFLPTEGLYSEILRIPGLVDTLRREYKIAVAGPSTLVALLSSLQVGFRTLAIEKRSSEVWELLGGVKTEFEKFGGVLGKVRDRLEKAQGDIGIVEVRTRAMSRKLRSVEALPEALSSPLLVADGLDPDQDREDEQPARVA